MLPRELKPTISLQRIQHEEHMLRLSAIENGGG